MAQYLRSLSPKIPTAACLTTATASVLFSKYETQFSFNNNSHIPITVGRLPVVPAANTPYSNVYRGFPMKTNIRADSLSKYQTGCGSSAALGGKDALQYSANPKPKPLPNDNDSQKGKSTKDKDADGKPSPDQINRIYLKLQDELPKFFSEPLDYSFYSQDIAFVDNIRGVTTKGLSAYIQQMYFVKIFGNLKLANVKVELVSMSQDLKDGKIVVHWRVKGYLRFLLRFWYTNWGKTKEEQWHEGISYYDIDGDGKIFRHSVDRMMEDKDHLMDVRDRKLRILQKLKLAGASGAFVTPIVFGTLECLAPST